MSASFEPGEPPAESFIPLCIPEIRGNEWKYIKECLDTNWVSSVGTYVNRFEEMVADYVGTAHAVATINGTSALHIALLVAGVEPDDEVLVSTLTFIAPANAIRYAGAWPVFIDAEPEYWQMAPQNVVDFLEQGCDVQNGEVRNKRTGRRVKAIMPVHILGHPVDMAPIVAVARKYKLLIIEDATESLGAQYKGHQVGHLGDIACFSFNGNKILTTGGGGMIVTDNEAWAHKAKYLTTQAKDDAVEYIHHEIGYNYRLTNIQAAMGCAQMENLDEYIAAKRRIAATYTKAFAEITGLTPMREATWASSIFWMYTLLVDESEYGQDSRQLLRRLQEAKIQARPLWEPLHCSLAHRQTQPSQTLGVADKLYQQALSLPCSVGLTLSDQNRIIDLIIKDKR
ncbi:MAG TPA: LegC family aminotransferase [Thiotrichaceae bacterium]|nr:LegC family aminotransferase [Thiotrichaceae bacterium]